jgi:hypothetical protein
LLSQVFELKQLLQSKERLIENLKQDVEKLKASTKSVVVDRYVCEPSLIVMKLQQENRRLKGLVDKQGV